MTGATTGANSSARPRRSPSAAARAARPAEVPALCRSWRQQLHAREACRPQLLPHLRGLEETQPRLAGLCRALRYSPRRVARRGERQHDFAACWKLRDGAQHRIDRVLAQIHGHAEPGKERARRRCDRMPHESVTQRLALEVDGREADVRRHREAGSREVRAFQLLCARVIDFEDAQALRPRRLSHCERVEAGAEDDILRDAAIHGGSEAILGKPRSQHHVGPQGADFPASVRAAPIPGSAAPRPGRARPAQRDPRESAAVGSSN